MTGLFLSVSRVLPDRYPLQGELDDYIADEHAVGRLVDLGVIVPTPHRAVSLVSRRAADPRPHRPRPRRHPGVAWDPDDRRPWAPPPRRLVRAVRRALPPSRPPSSTSSGSGQHVIAQPAARPCSHWARSTACSTPPSTSPGTLVDQSMLNERRSTSRRSPSPVATPCLDGHVHARHRGACGIASSQIAHTRSVRSRRCGCRGGRSSAGWPGPAGCSRRVLVPRRHRPPTHAPSGDHDAHGLAGCRRPRRVRTDHDVGDRRTGRSGLGRQAARRGARLRRSSGDHGDGARR